MIQQTPKGEIKVSEDGTITSAIDSDEPALPTELEDDDRIECAECGTKVKGWKRTYHIIFKCRDCGKFHRPLLPELFSINIHADVDQLQPETLYKVSESTPPLKALIDIAMMSEEVVHTGDMKTSLNHPNSDFLDIWIYTGNYRHNAVGFIASTTNED